MVRCFFQETTGPPLEAVLHQCRQARVVGRPQALAGAISVHSQWQLLTTLQAGKLARTHRAVRHE